MGEVEQDESDKETRKEKHNIVNKRISIAPLFIETLQKLNGVSIKIQFNGKALEGINSGTFESLKLIIGRRP